MEKLDPLRIAGGDVKLYRFSEKSLAVSLKKLPCDPAIIFLGNYAREVKTYVHPKTHRQMSLAALFIIAKNWKQPRCPLVGELLNRPWFPYYGILLSN